MTDDGGATGDGTDSRTREVLAEFFDSPQGRALLREVLDRVAAEKTAGGESEGP